MFKGLKVTIDGTEIFIDYPFGNQNGGTTQWADYPPFDGTIRRNIYE